MDEAQTLFRTALFAEEVARFVANEARKVEGLDSEEVTALIRGMYAHAKKLKDRRAALLAPAPKSAGNGGTPTNVGDPNAKGMKGATKR